ncbi:MAG TPA: CoA transferase [Ramlibacter sp.]|nr:CoA transferase [Ramlibacter sp.]
MPGPLAGLRVLDVATIIAGPSAAALLADYGADVVKVELPRIGDGARGFPPHKDGVPLWWKVTNRGKRFVTLDLRRPEGAQLLLRMLPRFDVLVENFRPGTLDGWGLDKRALWAAQPSLVILRATGFGQTGPYRDRPGFARVFEAMGGLTHITGDPAGEPMHAGYPVADNVGGLFGAVGVLAALWRRAQDPQARGEEIDLSLTEATLKLLEFLPIEHQLLGTVRHRSGNANQYSAPAAVYRTADGHWVSLSGSTNPLFANNCRAIGRPDLVADPRFADNASRVRHAAELNRVFADWCAQRPLQEVLDAFQAAQGTLAPIYDIEQIEADPQIRARGALCDVPDADFGRVRMAGVVPRFGSAPCEIRHAGRALGADNEGFWRDELGLAATELDGLRAAGVI